jgi:hypothetical protein
MTWETFSCCCNQAPCICAGVYSSITVKWTGKVIFSPLPCREYWRRWVSNPSSGCGLPSRLSLVGPTTYEIPSIVVPGLNVSSCLSYACVNRQSAMNRHFASFTPFPGSPEYFDPIARCQYDQLDNVFGPYQLAYRHQVTVFGPNTNPGSGLPPSPKWRVRIQIGSVVLNYVSTGSDYSCDPGIFAIDPSIPSPNPDDCHSPCIVSGACQTQGGLDCVILNPPPPPSSYPGGGGAGSTYSHAIEVIPGTVQVG